MLWVEFSVDFVDFCWFILAHACVFLRIFYRQDHGICEQRKVALLSFPFQSLDLVIPSSLHWVECAAQCSTVRKPVNVFARFSNSVTKSFFLCFQDEMHTLCLNFRGTQLVLHHKHSVGHGFSHMFLMIWREFPSTANLLSILLQMDVFFLSLAFLHPFTAPTPPPLPHPTPAI